MKVLNIVSGQLSGGATRAGVLLHNEFLKCGIQSALYNTRFAWSNKSEQQSLVTSDKAPISSKVNSYVSRKLAASRSHKFSWNLVQSPIPKEIMRANWDAVFLHYNADGGLTHRQILSILDRCRNFIVILRDDRALTGGCHYPLDCNGWKHGCVSCPRSRAPKALLARDYEFWSSLAGNERVQFAVFNPTDYAATVHRFGAEVSMRVHIVPNCFDPFFEDALIRTWKQRSTDLMFGAVNVQDAYKGPKLLASFLQINAHQFPNISSFGGASALERVSHLGVLGRNTLRAHLERTKYLLVPSVFETFGKIIPEAVCCGAWPIVFAGSGGPEEIVRSLGWGTILQDSRSSMSAPSCDDFLKRAQEAKQTTIRLYSSRVVAKRLIQILR